MSIPPINTQNELSGTSLPIWTRDGAMSQRVPKPNRKSVNSIPMQSMCTAGNASNSNLQRDMVNSNEPPVSPGKRNQMPLTPEPSSKPCASKLGTPPNPVCGTGKDKLSEPKSVRESEASSLPDTHRHPVLSEPKEDQANTFSSKYDERILFLVHRLTSAIQYDYEAL
ncbi:hypothetical protein ACHAPF_007296 [Botrytis cinerea]